MEEIEVEVTIVRQKCDYKVKDVLFEGNGLQVRLDRMAAQL